jgi:hypothetical protein
MQLNQSMIIIAENTIWCIIKTNFSVSSCLFHLTQPQNNQSNNTMTAIISTPFIPSTTDPKIIDLINNHASDKPWVAFEFFPPRTSE